MRLRLALAIVCLSAFGVVHAAPIADALERPALISAHPQQVVLMAAATAGNRLVAVGERGIVIWSDTSGADWHQAQVPVSVTLTSVHFVDSQRGWAAGHAGVVLASQDGGQTWEKQLDGHVAARLMLEDAESRKDAVALKEAERLVSDGADKPFLDLHFFDAERGIVVGASNLAFATSDGGHTWNPISNRIENPRALHLYSLSVKGDVLLIAGEEGVVFKSDDAGHTFRRFMTPYKGSFFTCELLSSGEMLVAGLRGNVWRSSDDGANWAQLKSPASVSFTASAVLGDQEIVLANQAGQLFFLRDNKLQQLPASPLPAPAGLLSLNDGRLLALTMRGAIPVSAVLEGIK